MWERVLKSCAIGGLSGACGTLLGLGGGLVAIPLMTSSRVGLCLTQHQAHGTSLAVVASAGLFGALGFYASSSDLVDFPAAGAMVTGGMASSWIGTRVASSLPACTLRMALGIYMLCIAPMVPAKKYLMANLAQDGRGSINAAGAPLNVHSAAKLLVIGLCAGFLGGIFGVGGGTIVVPALSLGVPERINSHKKALGTSLMSMPPMAMVGCVANYRSGKLLPDIAMPLMLGTSIGGFACSNAVAGKVPDELLQWVFTVFMLGMGSFNVYKGLNSS
eukprot:gene1827-461_t